MGTLSAMDSAWKPVNIGAGGWITGIDIAPDGTMVGRTDTYGAYVWNGTSWSQLVTTASMPSTVLSAGGVYEIRVAASNSNIFYMEMGDGIYKSTDKGTTWIKTGFPATTFDPNSDHRMDGQKLAIDPTNPNVVYAGTQTNGLWVTRDGGSTWSKISAVPQGTNTTDPALTGITIKGSTVYVGTAGSGVFASTDSGTTWKAIGGPADIANAAIAPDGSYYAAGKTDGSLWKYSGGSWTKLIADSVHGVAIDPFNPLHVVVTGDGGNIQETKDGGATWSGWNWANQLESSTDVPWLANSGGYMSSGGLVFDPLQAGKVWQSSGVGVWETTLSNQALSWNTPVVWHSQSMGIEQLVANEVLAPAGGDPVFASWDRAFIDMANPDAYATSYSGGGFSAGWSIDYASSNPSFMVGISDWWGHDDSGFSVDGGKTWQKFAGLPSWALSTVGGSIAASSPTNFLWAATGNQPPAYTLDGGKTWTNINIPGITDWSGLNYSYYLDRTSVTADRVLPHTFYLYDCNSGVYRSTDGGVTWSKVFSGQPADWSYWNAKFESVPGSAGELFLTSGPQGTSNQPTAFVHSKDGGATWQTVAGVGANTFGYGAPATAGGPATIFIVGTVNGKYGVWYSTDDAATWTQIGDHPLGSLDNIRTISGDMDQFGRVYIGFGGSGYAYLDIPAAGSTNAAPAPTTPPAAIAAPTPSVMVPGQIAAIADAHNDLNNATVSSGALVNDKTPGLHGTLSAALGVGQSVMIYRDGLKIGAAVVANGEWTFTDPGASDGSHTYVAQVEDQAGNHGLASNNFNLIIDATAPTEHVVITSAMDDFGPVSGTIANGGTTDDSAPVLNGTLSAALGSDETLAVFRDGFRIGAATVSGTGWSYADSNLSEGTHTYTTSVVDAAGNVGPASSGFSLSLATLRYITGTTGNDNIVGTASADMISGVNKTGGQLGKGSIDVLTGGLGADIFVLGDSRGRFYDDGRATSSGKLDYARITDFSADDKLQLKGVAANYFQVATTVDGFSGTGIYHDSNGNGVFDSRDELIALIQNHSPIDLSAQLYV